MFTGIVEELGRVAALDDGAGIRRLTIASSLVVGDLRVSHSVAVNGVCLTAVEVTNDAFTVEVVPETLRRSNLGDLRVDAAVNLERALPADGRFGGHFVQGHVDDTADLTAREPDGGSERVTFRAPAPLMRYIVEKGFVAVDGVSLTVAAVENDRFEVALIPQTLAMVTLGDASSGYRANVEADVLAKYVERLVRGDGATLSMDDLRAAGFGADPAP